MRCQNSKALNLHSLSDVIGSKILFSCLSVKSQMSSIGDADCLSSYTYLLCVASAMYCQFCLFTSLVLIIQRCYSSCSASLADSLGMPVNTEMSWGLHVQVLVYKRGEVTIYKDCSQIQVKMQCQIS